MTIIKFPHRWQNGNCRIDIYEDGTKYRTWPDGAEPQPRYPESLDLLITKMCTIGCSFCYMNAQPNGAHADLDWLKFSLAKLPAGVELALGGGDPLAYPQLEELLKWCRNRGLICNITIRNCGDNLAPVYELQKRNLVQGVGISGWDNYFDRNYAGKKPRNVVYHYIMGIDNPLDVVDDVHYLTRLYSDNYHSQLPGILILGYKHTGRAANTQPNIDLWHYWWPRIANNGSMKIAFDNLAIDQLDLPYWFKSHDKYAQYQARYMGADGEFTMYVNGVDRTYAVNSVSDEMPFDELNIADAFTSLQRDQRGLL